MTEEEWLTCVHPPRMLYRAPRVLIQARGWDDRKRRLFECACCRRYWQAFADDCTKQAIVVAERYSDHQATAEELNDASDAASQVWNAELDARFPGWRDGFREGHPIPLLYSAAGYNITIPTGWWGGAPAFVAPNEIIQQLAENPADEMAAHCNLLRDIFGNPFRPVSLNPFWLTLDVRGLAEGIYDERAFGRMPILADALEDAGCDNEDILNHCRQPGEHVRGCWVVDLILGKQ